MIRIDDPGDPRLAGFRDIKERDLVGREGRFIAEGKVVLSVLCTQAPQDIEALLVLENRIAGISDILAKLQSHTPVYMASTAVVDAIAGFHLHRGLIAIARRPALQNPLETLRGLSHDALVIAACGISNHDNMGSIFRNAAAFEAALVVLDETSCDPYYRKAIRVSVGAVLQVPHARVGSLGEMCETLTNEGFTLGALSPHGKTPIEAFPKDGKRALLLGSEGKGLPDSTLGTLDTFRIPMSPGFDSLNVGTTSGIALYHASKFSSR